MSITCVKLQEDKELFENRTEREIHKGIYRNSYEWQVSFQYPEKTP